MLGLTKALAAELAPRNIRVNCIAPGVIETKFASAVSTKRILNLQRLAFLIHLYLQLTGNEEVMDATMAFTPMKRQAFRKIFWFPLFLL